MKAKTKKLLLLGGVAAGAVLVGRKLYSSGLKGLLGLGEDAPVNPNETPGAVAPATPSSLTAAAAAPAITGVKKSGLAKWLLPVVAIGAAYMLFFRKK